MSTTAQNRRGKRWTEQELTIPLRDYLEALGTMIWDAVTETGSFDRKKLDHGHPMYELVVDAPGSSNKRVGCAFGMLMRRGYESFDEAWAIVSDAALRFAKK